MDLVTTYFIEFYLRRCLELRLFISKVSDLEEVLILAKLFLKRGL